MSYSNFRVLQPASGPLPVIGHSCNSIYTPCVCTCARLPMHAHPPMLAHQQTHTFNLMKASEKKKKKKKMTETAVCADQSSSNGLNFLRFSCCLLFCVGGNPIGGLRKSQSKCFQMMMSCWKKKEKISKKKKKVFYSLTLWKKSHGTLMLISCWHEADYAVRQHYTLHLCTTLGSFVQNWGETADFTEGQ